MQRKRRRPKNPTRKLATILRDVNRYFPEWEASIVEAYAPTGSERVLLFRVRDRLSGSTVFQITSPTDRCVGAERWLQSAKRQLLAVR
jgi:hypothetical protein